MVETIQDNLPGMRRPLKGWKWTDEQMARAQARKKQRRAVELGICRADCEICGGQGFLRNNVALGEPGFGKMHLCPNSDRWRQPGNARSGISIKEASQLHWSSMDETSSIGTAVAEIQQALARGYGWVYVYGGFGTGKTQVLKIAVAEALRARKTAAYVRMAEILDHLQERRFVLMDRRYEGALRQENVTIMASNSDPVNLPDYLYDRIRDGRFRVVSVSGKSMRPGMGE